MKGALGVSNSRPNRANMGVGMDAAETNASWTRRDDDEPRDGGAVAGEDVTRVMSSTEALSSSPLFDRLGAGAVQGTRVGRYVLLEPLGRGAMGQVYLAYDPDLTRHVALKLLRPDLAAASDETGADPKRRFLREAQAAAQLVHPHVVAVHEAGIERGIPFIAMELVRGQTLKEWMASQGGSPHPWREVVELFEQAGRGLMAAHAAQILHRDFKPDNVLLDGEGRAKVADFGLASRASTVDGSGSSPSLDMPLEGADGGSVPPSGSWNDVRLTVTGNVMGTPAYMAPEQHRTARVDARADVFSFCAALYEALYGERPFRGDDMRAVFRAKISGPPRPPDGAPRVPRWLADAVRRGLEPKRDRRFDSIESVLEAFEHGRRRRRRRMGLSAVAMAAAAVAAGIGGARLTRESAIAACEAEGAAIEETWNDRRARALSGALADSHVPHAEEAFRRVRPWLDDYAAQWRAGRSSVCVQTEVDASFVWEPSLLERSRWCFDERRSRLDALVTLLEEADAVAATRAVGAVADLPELASCADPHALREVMLPAPERRDEIRGLHRSFARLDALHSMGRYDAASELATKLRPAVAQVDWAPATVAFDRRRADLAMELGRYDEAASLYEETYFAAMRAEVPVEAIESAGGLGYLLVTFRHEPAMARRWTRHVDVLLDQIPDPLSLRRSDNLNLRGILRDDMSDFEGAEALYRDVLAIRREALGDRHPDVARALENLAGALRKQGELEEALELNGRATEIKEATLGPRHPSVASSLNHRALLLQDAQMYEEAEAISRRSVELLEEIHGPEHLDVAMGLNNLALILDSQRDFEGAQAVQLRAIRIKEKVLGPESADVAVGYDNLGLSYYRAEKYARAREAYARSQEIQSRSLDPDDPDQAYAIGGLAAVERELGNLEAARDGFARALELREKAFGPEHGRVAWSLEDLAEVYRKMGNFEEARRLFGRALSIHESVSGRRHERLAGPLFGLAETALDDGRPADAVAAIERLLTLEFAGEKADVERAAARFMLGKARHALDDDDEPVELVRAARAVLAAEGEAEEKLVAEIDDWLSEI